MSTSPDPTPTPKPAKSKAAPAPSAPNRASRDRATYDLLAEAFRAKPGNFYGVSKLTLCSRPFVKEAWVTGWPEHEWAKPLQSVLAGEADAKKIEIAEEASTLSDAELILKARTVALGLLREIEGGAKSVQTILTKVNRFVGSWQPKNIQEARTGVSLAQGVTGQFSALMAALRDLQRMSVVDSLRPPGTTTVGAARTESELVGDVIQLLEWMMVRKGQDAVTQLLSGIGYMPGGQPSTHPLDSFQGVGVDAHIDIHTPKGSNGFH